MSGLHPRPVDVLIAGAQKAGTSSLAAYLGRHPEICTHDRLEFSYFVDDLDYSEGYEKSFRRYFGNCEPNSLLLAKSVTVMTHPELIRRARDHNQQMRVIITLRNPVDRAYSAYWWARRNGYEPLTSFEQALSAAPERHGGNLVKVRSTSYLQFGEYAEQVANLFRILGRERVHVVLFDDLKEDASAVVRDCLEFVGIQSTFIPETSTRENSAGRARSVAVAKLLTARSPLKRRIREALPPGWIERWKRHLERWNTVPFRPPPMEDEVRGRLTEHFRPHNELLGQLIGRDLHGWSR